MSTEPTGLTEEQRYRFDCDGYLVVEDVLSDEEVDALNRLVDERDLPEPSAETGGSRRFQEFLSWGEPFRDLLDHDLVMGVLRDLLGDGFRLDHYYGIYLDAGADPLVLHGGGTPYDPAQFYHSQHGNQYNGLTVVTWNLTDSGGDHGGFCCVPGSHEANFECPESVSEAVGSATRLSDLPDPVVVPEAPAGSMTVFTEALTHGTAPWVADHQRRSLLYKYSPGHMSWADNFPEPPDGVSLSERQELLFEPPHVYRRESLFGDEE
ncbi:MAG: phytanoyl-CoA dioxygenase family protein [Halobacteriaceae archaeon]